MPHHNVDRGLLASPIQPPSLGYRASVKCPLPSGTSSTAAPLRRRAAAEDWPLRAKAVTTVRSNRERASSRTEHGGRASTLMLRDRWELETQKAP